LDPISALGMWSQLQANDEHLARRIRLQITLRNLLSSVEFERIDRYDMGSKPVLEWDLSLMNDYEFYSN